MKKKASPKKREETYGYYYELGKRAGKEEVLHALRNLLSVPSNRDLSDLSDQMRGYDQ